MKRVCSTSMSGVWEGAGDNRSSVVGLRWTLHKERHDRMLYRLMMTLSRKYGLTVPEGLRWGPDGWNGVAVLEGPDANISVDLSIPTDKQMKARRPDLVPEIDRNNGSCMYVGTSGERTRIRESHEYRDLGAELASQNPG